MKTVLIAAACALVATGCADLDGADRHVPATQGLVVSRLAPDVFEASIRVDANESADAVQHVLEDRAAQLCGAEPLMVTYSGGIQARQWHALNGSATMLVPDNDRYLVATVACRTS